MDGLLGFLRSAVNQRARKLSIELQQRRDLVPDDPEIASTYLSHVGTPIKKFFDEVMTPQFRNAIAHFITKDGSILNLELTPFRGHLIVHTEGVRSVQTVHPQAALSGAVS